jgi:shikimate kinase
MPRIFLVGFMGAGKSSVGAALAGRLGCDFVDLDTCVSERFAAPINEIFERHGEAIFRAAEAEELARCADSNEVVVATGGGTFCDSDNRELIHAAGGVSVFLDLPWEALAERLSRDHAKRPLYGDAERARRLFMSRLPLYRQASLRISLGGSESPDEVADRVFEMLQEARCAI